MTATGLRASSVGETGGPRHPPSTRPMRTCTPLAMKTERTPKPPAPAISVATPSPIASTRSLATGAPRRAAADLERQFVDRRKGLAGVADDAAQRLVGGRDRAGAIDDAAATLDRLVGIGADHRHSARSELGEQVRVIGGRFRLVFVEAGADGDLGIARPSRPATARSPAKTGEVALGTDVQHAPPGPDVDETPRDVARAHDAVIGGRRDADAVELPRDAVARTRRVGDEQHGAALLRNASHAATDVAYGRTPLCMTPQMSTNQSSDVAASGAIDGKTGMSVICGPAYGAQLSAAVGRPIAVKVPSCHRALRTGSSTRARAAAERLGEPEPFRLTCRAAPNSGP